MNKRVYSPLQKYNLHRRGAGYRNIEWLYTFETWWKQWEDSGKWEVRGNKKGQYCMARKGDIGPYSPENVDIILSSQNNIDAKSGYILSTEARKNISEFRMGKPLSEETKEKMRGPRGSHPTVNRGPRGPYKKTLEKLKEKNNV